MYPWIYLTNRVLTYPLHPIVTSIVELKWVKVPEPMVEVGLGKEISIECDAVGLPVPTIYWLKHESSTISEKKNSHHNCKSMVF